MQICVLKAVLIKIYLQNEQLKKLNFNFAVLAKQNKHKK